MIFEKLHADWEKEHSLEADSQYKTEVLDPRIKKPFYQRDGIINLNEYNKARIKVLFISNEANIANKVNELKDENDHINTDCRIDYDVYSRTGIDDWDGKMRERITALYMFLTNQQGPIHHFANQFAFVDLNKRGGASLSKDCSHIKEYCKNYKKNILKELSMINPQIIVWIGVNSFDCGIPEVLGAYSKNTKKYININGNNVPILRMWHTSYRYSGGLEPCGEFRDIRIRRLCAKLKTEMDKYNI